MDAEVAAIDRVFEWDESQTTAINRCCDMVQRIVPITGVAGTGKTTIIREVYTTLSDAGYSVVICAPTGKAAKRIQDATGIPAMTMHRLLEYPHPGERDPETGKALVSTVPKRDKRNPIPYKIVLADEYAMVDLELHRNLIDALMPGGRVCMFGDVNQLTPIRKNKLANKESPFQAALRKFDGTVLNRVYRTTVGSDIAVNCDRILSNKIPLRKDEFVLKITNTPVTALIDLVMDMLDRGINMGTNDGQVISATSKSWIGTYKLNMALQDMLNPIGSRERIKLRRHRWQENMPITVGVGDKVIWTENAYDLRNPWERYVDGDPRLGWIPTPPDKIIMNGESGRVTEITEDGDITIDLGDRIVNIPHSLTVEVKNVPVNIDPRRTIDLGFCITTHKAQGSEWPHIIYMLNKSTGFMQSRHNFYTAVSRARQSVTVISDQYSLQHSVMRSEAPIDRIKG